jgi:hypothetical protein
MNFLLIMPEYSDFQNLFVENLKFAGYNPYLITEKYPKFKYKNFERIINLYQKTFKKNRLYKKKLIDIQRGEYYLKKIESFNISFDVILFIRPDSFPLDFVKSIKEKTQKFIGYQWDGIEKFPLVKKYINYFDLFYCFEKSNEFPDLIKTTNFYFDFKPQIIKPYNFEKPTIYFVGLFWERREEKINEIVKILKKYNLKLNITLQVYLDKPKLLIPEIKYISKRISFEENIEEVIKSDILLDVIDPVHKGLSIRFFEAMYYKKKVITDNIEVKNYEFYDSNNIFVIENNNLENLTNFLKMPYKELTIDTKKYGFTNWIHNIINN